MLTVQGKIPEKSVACDCDTTDLVEAVQRFIQRHPSAHPNAINIPRGNEFDTIFILGFDDKTGVPIFDGDDYAKTMDNKMILVQRKVNVKVRF